MIRAIVFDKDGTLLDYESFWIPVAEAAIRALLSARVADVYTGDELYPALLTAIGAGNGIMGVLCHGTYGDIAAAMEPARKALLPQSAPFDANEVARAFEVSINRGRMVPVCDNLPDTFATLKARGLSIGLVTSDNRAITEHCLTALGILPYFDIIRTDDGISPAKPHPHHMTAFCEALGYAPDEVVMVGDTETDMRFAYNSGAHAVAVAKRTDNAARLSAMAEVVLHDVSELPAWLDKHALTV